MKLGTRTLAGNFHEREVLSKVPAITLGFWVIKILATTLGETGGDSVTMSWLGETTDHATPNGYLIGTALFATALIVLVIAQVAAKKFDPFLYWATIVASTTAGTTMADFFDRSLGLGYSGGSALLFLCVIVSLTAWYFKEGSVSVNSVNTPRMEAFYWLTITFSQTLGTALGDWAADTGGLGYGDGMLVFAGMLAVLAAAYYFTRISHVLLFWLAFILTRPLGATAGDLLDKPWSDGGFNVSRPLASLLIAVALVVFVLVFPQRPGSNPAKASDAGDEAVP